MNRQLIQVGAFLEAIGAPVSSYPQDTVSRDALVERRKQEEKADEKFIDAFLPLNKQVSIEHNQALLGLATRLYVVLGDAHTLGLAHLLPVAFEMLHQSNVGKLWNHEQITESGSFVPALYKGQELLVCFDNKGKLIPPPGWEGPAYSDLFDELAGQQLLDFEHASKIYFGEETLDGELAEDEPAPGFVNIEDYDEYQMSMSLPEDSGLPDDLDEFER